MALSSTSRASSCSLSRRPPWRNRRASNPLISWPRSTHDDHNAPSRCTPSGASVRLCATREPNPPNNANDAARCLSLRYSHNVVTRSTSSSRVHNVMSHNNPRAETPPPSNSFCVCFRGSPITPVTPFTPVTPVTCPRAPLCAPFAASSMTTPSAMRCSRIGSHTFSPRVVTCTRMRPSFSACLVLFVASAALSSRSVGTHAMSSRRRRRHVLRCWLPEGFLLQSSHVIPWDGGHGSCAPACLKGFSRLQAARVWDGESE